MTAGVAATRNVLPMDTSIKSSDSILSSFTLAEPYGKAVAYTAILEGASFATTRSTARFPEDYGKRVGLNCTTVCC